MNLKEAADGHTIQEGDFIRVDTRVFGRRDYKVHRVTKQYAFVKWNDNAEGKFPRVYNKWTFQSYPKQEYSTTDYSVLIEDK